MMNENFFEILFENASDAMLVVNLEKSKIENCNEALCFLTGFSKTELIGNKIQTLAPEKDPKRSEVFGLNIVGSTGFYEDVALRGRDGLNCYISLSVKVIDLASSKYSLCILRDVGEKKKMERDLITKHSELRNAYVDLEKANIELKSMQEALVQSGKLAALGELAAGIAHELNQPLTVIKGFAQESEFILENNQKDSKEIVLSNLKEVVKSSDKMHKIISHLRNFTRKSVEDFAWVNLHDVIEESFVMLGKQLELRGIKTIKEFDTKIPKIYCNPFQLEQVFINLASNARDAIESKKELKGQIRIKTLLLENNMVEVRFEDNGIGISDEVKGKVFNPFFTTKEVGQGMGLGLSISYGILSRINASIVLESSVGKGTTFKVRVPVDYRKH